MLAGNLDSGTAGPQARGQESHLSRLFNSPRSPQMGEIWDL